MPILFFPTPDDFRRWLEAHHHQEQELWVGFYKKGSGKPSVSWPESVDQALCFGWIDGIRKRIDDTSYKIRFTPRKRSSHWSAVNIERVKELTEQGLMHSAGLKAFQNRDEKKAKGAAYEQENIAFPVEYETIFKANKKAWNYFQSQAPWYQRTATWWVISAKKEETRQKRLATLMEDSEQGRPIKSLLRNSK
ncbi:MAG: YdeI/OmpD-associated family protein [Saprospiraceae bacterium]|nr:YdeI/OmpD-associated family protein [Saprospiraceae bacterium]